MSKKIIKYFLLSVLLFYSKTNADYIICDSWNINYNWKTVSEICNWWYQSIDISKINSFTWSFIDLDLWYWWTDFDLVVNSNIEENLPMWYFGINIKTKVLTNNPENYIYIWYIWTKNDYNITSNLDENFPVWYFDTNTKTKVLNNKPEFSLPIWYLWNVVITKKNWWINNNISPIYSMTYREFFKEIFQKSTNDSFNNLNYSESEYNTFIDNLLDLLVNSNQFDEEIIPEETKNRIKFFIQNSDFDTNLNLLMTNLKDINQNFEIQKDQKINFYMIKYYLLSIEKNK